MVLSDLRPYGKNIIFLISENKHIRHICSYMGISMVHSFSGCDQVMHSHDVTVKSLKTQNWQKMLKLVILDIPCGNLL